MAIGVAQLAVVGDTRKVGAGDVDARAEVLRRKAGSGGFEWSQVVSDTVPGPAGVHYNIQPPKQPQPAAAGGELLGKTSGNDSK